MSPQGWAVLIVIVAASVFAYLRNRMGDRLGRRLRAEWGRPLDRWRDMGGISAYHRSRAASESGEGLLDDRTWTDLHLDRVFSLIDRTGSTLGQQFLYRRLRSEPTETEHERFEALVSHFGAAEEARIDAQRCLARLTHSSGYRLWRICQKDGVELRRWYWIFPVLTTASVATIVAFFFWPRALLVLLALVAANITVRLKLAPHVFHVLGPFRQVAPLLDGADRILSTAPVSGLFDSDQVAADLRALRSLRRSAGWASRNDTVQNELVGSLWEYLNDLLLVDANATLLAARALASHGPALLRLIDALGEVDAAISTASLRAGEGAWCVPEFSGASDATTVTDAWHPLLEDPVANSVVLRPGRGLILTGSNMSGKSTFIRTIGVAVVLAQAIRTCPANSYVSPTRGLRVRSAIGREDDLATGRSYYLVEVDAVLELLRCSQSPGRYVFLFDEIFRGTNTVERLAAGEAVLQALPGERHVVVAATHDRELVGMLEQRYDPIHFEETLGPDGLTFPYRVLPGPARTRTAIALLETTGAPPELVARARQSAARLDAAAGRYE